MPEKPADDISQEAMALKALLEETITSEFEYELSEPTEIKNRKIIEYDSRMRISALEVFNGPCYISVVNFFVSDSEQKAGKPAGTFVLYLNEEYLEPIFKKLGHRSFDEDDFEFVSQSLKDWISKLASSLNSKLSSLGHSYGSISEGAVYRNTVAQGVPFPYELYDYTEMKFFFQKGCPLAADLVVKPK